MIHRPTAASRRSAQAPREVLFAPGRPEVDAHELLGAAEQVHVRVVEPRDDQAAAGVDDARRGARERSDVLGAADPRNPLAADGDRLCGRASGIHRVYLALTMTRSGVHGAGPVDWGNRHGC